VSQVRRLQEGEDARDVPFDNRYFPHKTNTLFVELELSTDSAKPESAVPAEIEMALRVDKGKRRAADG
jgi:hypothetical protein